MYSDNKVRKSAGITLVEILLTIGIISILSAGTMPLGISFLQRNHLRNTKDVLISYLNTARIFSIGAKNGSVWGVNVSEDEITLFSGTGYATRDPEFDTKYNIPQDVNVTLEEVIFSKYIGETSETSFLLEGATNESHTVSTNTKGDITLN
jgi:Tfp pilus assembly protein FimT